MAAWAGLVSKSDFSDCGARNHLQLSLLEVTAWGSNTVNESQKALLAEGAAAFGITLCQTQIEQFDAFESLLYKWNEVMNLTRVPREEVVTLHFLDSLSVAAATNLSRTRELLDVGTGAGFPGIPLKIAFPSLKVLLLDSLNKRTKFLDEVIQSLDLKTVGTLHARAEDAARMPDLRGRFECVTARAVASLRELSELLLPFPRIGGHVIAMKGELGEEEINTAKPAIKTLGGEIERTIDVSVTGLNAKRMILVLAKKRDTPQLYPRNPRKIKSEPITCSSCKK